MMSDFTIRSLQLSSNGSAGTLASSCTNDPESVMFTLQLAIITVLGAVMCLFSLVAQAGFIYFNIDQGEIAQIQAYSVWCASLAVIGHVNNAFGLSSTSDSACLAEAVTSNFGELALVLWQMGTAVIAIAITYPEWLRSGNNRRNLIISMHLLVWIPSLVTTIIPWSQGLLGYYGVESSDFCWFIPDNKPWELGQFYIPLYLASFVALSTFVFLVFRIKQLTGSITLSEASVVPSDATPSARSQTINIQKSSEQRQILIRLAFQLFATSFVFLPDSFLYMLSTFENDVPDWGFTLTAFIWKLESSAVATIWLSNARVRQGILQLFSQFNFGELEHNRSPATSMRTRNIAIAATAAPDELIDSITPPAEPTNDQLVIPIPHAVPNS